MAGQGIDTSGIDGIVGYRLRRAQVAVFARFQSRFAAAAVTPAEFAVLILVADNPGAKPSEVAAALGVQRANFVSLAAGLEARGLIDRRRDAVDRRVQALHLTGAGDELVQRIRGLQAAFEAEFVAALGGEAERDRLLTLLGRIG